MSTKDNFAQAMKELLNGEPPEKEEKKVAPSSFSSFSQPEPKRPGVVKETPRPAADLGENADAAMAIEEIPVMPPVPAEKPEPAPAPVPRQEYPAPAPVAAPAYPFNSYQPPAAPAPAPAVFAMPAEAGGATTIVAPGTVILGDMTTSGGLRIGGDIKGNLKVAGMMELNGKVIGDIEAIDAMITNSTIRGNITIQNTLTMDGATIVVGDVSARSVDINSKVKGNVTVAERSHFQSDAVVVGNLMSGTIIIDEGAMLKGDVAITNAHVEDVTVEEPDFDIYSHLT